YKVLFDMKGDINDLKKLTLELLKSKVGSHVQKENDQLIKKIYSEEDLVRFQETGDELEFEDEDVTSVPQNQQQNPMRLIPAPENRNISTTNLNLPP
ncbi:MAG TPA: sigma-54-dependent Fis family transcriptional regulator, partial [Flavobacteriaceae bacterium]|nr:sigma-54-dependent Fis family transcriptional regulator [Flavobacteriaceae bacterium]